jgi:YHS domain-containing protein
MFRYFILEILVPILIFTLVRSIFRTLFGSNRTVLRPDPRGSAPPSQPSVVAGGELKKDPVCGTYVSTSVSVTRKVDGELLHFCSTECRDKYRAA